MFENISVSIEGKMLGPILILEYNIIFPSK